MKHLILFFTLFIFSAPVFSEKAKQKIEESGITGIKFEEVEVM